jgi:hypothetical protein
MQFGQSPDLKQCLRKVGADGIGAGRSDALLSFRHTAGKSPQANHNFYLRKASAQTLAQRTSLTHSEWRLGRDANDFIAATFHLLQHVFHGADRQIAAVLVSRTPNQLTEHHSDELVRIVPRGNANDLGDRKAWLLKIISGCICGRRSSGLIQVID